MISLNHNSKGNDMYRLRDLGNGLFQIHVQDGPAFEGNEDMIFVAAQELGVHGPDLKIAKYEMRKMGHDHANFGIYGRFLYTGLDSKKKAA
jgi:hypothetical protein